MDQTIVIFTSADTLIRNGLVQMEGDAINAKLSPTVPIYAIGAKRLFALRDDNNHHVAFSAELRSGVLHFVHHRYPENAQLAAFIASLKGNCPDLRCGVGYDGMHSGDHERKDPYVAFTKFLSADFDLDLEFDALWAMLEYRDPIEDLLADQLDYLHSAFGGIPTTEGKALKAALDKSDKRQNVAELVTKLGSKPYETSLYADFTKLRDLILSLEDATNTA
ncbi:MAG: hypothetical protein IPP83_13540 [Flavobacteriales bacterium]|nr:hypothetical protein [Flavobacteriales bacterium]